MTATVWALCVYLLAPVVLTMSVVVLAREGRRAPVRFPHLTLMAISYVGLMVATICAVGGLLPRAWIVGTVFVALLVGLKGLLLLGTRSALKCATTRWWPERAIVRWAARRLIGH